MSGPVAVLLLVVAALAGSAAPARASAPEQDIVVTGVRDQRDPVAAFVEAVTIETGAQIARFEAPVCPLALGLPPGHGEVVEARIRQIADHLGIGTRGPECRANVVVVVAGRGADFIRRLRRERPELFSALELADIRSIARLAGPVRAWQLVEPRGADGRPMERIAFIESPGGPPRPVVRGFQLAGVMPSLTQRSTRQDLTHSFIVFDLDAVEGLTLLQIADHAAMRALARTAAPQLPAGRSILTIFADRQAGAAAATQLTRWDAAYLRALYRTTNTVTAHQQRSNVARTMRRDLESHR